MLTCNARESERADVYSKKTRRYVYYVAFTIKNALFSRILNPGKESQILTRKRLQRDGRISNHHHVLLLIRSSVIRLLHP